MNNWDFEKDRLQWDRTSAFSLYPNDPSVEYLVEQLLERYESPSDVAVRAGFTIYDDDLAHVERVMEAWVSQRENRS